MKRLVVAALLLLACALPGSAAPAAKPHPEKPIEARHPAITVFRMTFDQPHSGPPFRLGIGIGALSIGNYPQARGTVWLANDTLDDLSDVRMTIGFYSLRFNHPTGDERVYPLGKMNPKQTMAINFAVDVAATERVVPYVKILYRDQGTLYRTVSYPYGN